LGVVIVASTAALLGTTESPAGYDNESPYNTTYTFERNGIDGGFVELTREQPTASFLVTVHADALGPEGVMTTDGAMLDVSGTITTSELAEGAVAPRVSVKVSSPDALGVSEKVELESYSHQQALMFTGDCDAPPGSNGCKARFTVQVARQDEGAADGVVRFDWLFDVHSKALHPSTATGEVGPLDPPWTVEVTQP
jgi:hypothetical protein